MPKKAPKTNIKACYFVTKNHEFAEPMIQLLIDRLGDTGWDLTLSRVSVHLVFSKGEKHVHLSTSTLKNPAGGDTVYRVNGQYVSLRRWLEVESKTEEGYTFDERVTCQEHKYLLGGTIERVSMLSSESGVYVVADASAETHAMLSEYYSLADETSTLYGAFDENGQLWALEDSDEEW